MLSFLRRFFNFANERYVKKLSGVVKKVNALEEDLEKLSNDKLKERTAWFRERLSQGESLDALLPEAFATVREAAKRALGQRHYDVQLMGGVVLHRGMIAEMKTGEGKTLVSTLAIYLNALGGKGVHVVTVNDYLAQRDAAWMGQIYQFLGLTVGCIVHALTDEERRTAYRCDVTYATNNELGFDYLRDSMKTSLEARVQRPFAYAVIDEVDSILIDEARTPLIISGPAEKSSELYEKIDRMIPLLKDEDFEKDEKNRSVMLTESGMKRVEELVKEAGLLRGVHLYDNPNIALVHHVDQALKAHKSFAKDVDYIVKDDKVMLVDEFTGRVMEGRRFSDGLHQALEAKECVPVEIENQTLASITYQNYFRLYPKLSGMTGTAMTEAAELQEIYNLHVVAMPTNKPIQRQDDDDQVYRTFQEKSRAVLNLIKEAHKREQPILVGTVSIEKSEMFARLLTEHKIPHNVLNARQHQHEASIIAEAGAPGAITIATNMAGRGTDIQLGGSLKQRLENAAASDGKAANKISEAEITAQYEKDKAKVLESGGLFVIGTERHESRRIDNQLRGRSGRQGDPGRSQFFLSLEDDLMRIFGSERLDDWLKKLGLKEDEAITHPWINRALEKAQQKVEARNFDIRKHLLKYDDVMNDQRKVLYSWRDDILKDPLSAVDNMRETLSSYLDRLFVRHVPKDTYVDQWTLDELAEALKETMGLVYALPEKAELAREDVISCVQQAATELYEAQAAQYGEKVWPFLVSQTLLKNLDHNWKEHLYGLDHLRQGVHLRSYAQKDPLNEYKREAFLIFQNFFISTQEATLFELIRLEVEPSKVTSFLDALAEEGAPPPFVTNDTGVPGIFPSYPMGEEMLEGASERGAPPLPPSRNAPCPCGSGKRYKNCHGKLS